MWLIILRMRRVSMKVSAVVTQTTLPTMIITMVSILSPDALPEGTFHMSPEYRTDGYSCVVALYGARVRSWFPAVVLSKKLAKVSRRHSHGIIKACA